MRCRVPELWRYCVLALLVAGPVFALSTDRDQPIYIDADWVRVNDKTGLSEYQGNVKLKQGSMVITADQMTVRQNGGELQTIVINGAPATFSQLRDGEEQPVQAQATKMEYHASKKRIYLIGDALVKQGPNEFRGERIEYDTAESTVTASKGDGNGRRVRAVITPGTLSDEDGEQ